MNKIEELTAKLCPGGVKSVKLSEAADIIRGTANPQKKAEISGDSIHDVGVLAPSDIYFERNIIVFDNVKRVQKPEKLQDSQYLRADDILICCAGGKELIGKAAFIEDDLHYTFNRQFLSVIRLKESAEVLPRFVFHVLSAAGFRSYLHSNIDTAKLICHLNAEVLGDFEIPVPPMPVQEEIVRIFDEFIELTDSLIMELSLRKQQNEYYRSKLLTFKADGKSGENQEKFDIKALNRQIDEIAVKNERLRSELGEIASV